MEMTSRKYRLTGISPILGSITQDIQTFEEYLAMKGKNEKEVERALVDIDNIKPENGEVETKITGFYRDNNGLILKAYQIKGFLKEAGNALKKSLGVSQWVSRIDNFVFINPSNIPIINNGKQIEAPDSILTRPLRGMTAQGPRVSLAKSEMVDHWSIDVEINIIANEKTKTSNALDFDIIENVLDYGALKGLLQWRNGGYGSFKWERIDD